MVNYPTKSKQTSESLNTNKLDCMTRRGCTVTPNTPVDAETKTKQNMTDLFFRVVEKGKFHAENSGEDLAIVVGK